MSGELFPYQKEAIQWLSNRSNALLALEMGLGKTVIAIKAADKINAKNILVICMAIGRINWEREFRKWSGKTRKINILRTKKDLPITDRAGIVNIASYDYLHRHSDKLKTPWDLLIFDESHLLKNPKSKRTKAALGKEGLVRNAQRTWCLSGTPAPNNYSELWTTLFTFGATKLPFGEFTEEYCRVIQTEYGPIIRGNRMDKLKEMKALLAKVMLRRKKEKGMLPDIFFQEMPVEAGKVDFWIHKDLFSEVYPRDRSKEMLEKITEQEQKILDQLKLFSDESASEKINFRTLEALATSVSTLRKYNGLQKVNQVLEQVAYELENNDYQKIVIFAVHRSVIDVLERGLEKFTPCVVHGGKKEHCRQVAVDKFQTDKNARVFIGNIQAAGTSITLTAAHHVLFLEQDWVPGNNAQAMMRVHRIGQTKPVLVRFAVIPDSIDEKITQVLKRKSKELIAIFDKDSENHEHDSTYKNEFSVVPQTPPTNTKTVLPEVAQTTRQISVTQTGDPLSSSALPKFVATRTELNSLLGENVRDTGGRNEDDIYS